MELLILSAAPAGWRHQFTFKIIPSTPNLSCVPFLERLRKSTFADCAHQLNGPDRIILSLSGLSFGSFHSTGILSNPAPGVYGKGKLTEEIQSKLKLVLWATLLV